MFIPKLYRSEDLDLMKKIINENAFALLISNQEKLWATHSMFLWNEAKEGFLETHISKANSQAKYVNNGDEVLCDFLGAHSYISSSWYDHINVSTWNYEAVQIRGKIKIMDDEMLYQHLKKLTDKYEHQQKCPMNFDKMGDDFVRKEMKGTIGFKIYPTEIHIATKLSQNRNSENYQNIIKELQHSTDENSKKIAKSMQAIINKKEQ